MKSMRINNFTHCEMMKKLCRAALLMILMAAFAACNAKADDLLLAPLEIPQAWAQGWHGVWELQWSAMPVPGPVVFEGWVTENRARQRYEILEADVPSLVGLAYVNDGSAAIIFNRLEETVPPERGGGDMPFSPVTDALAKVDRTLAQLPAVAQIRRAGTLSRVDFSPAPGEAASVWVDETCGCVIRVTVHTSDSDFVLAARSMTKLDVPQPHLFEPKQLP